MRARGLGYSIGEVQLTAERCLVLQHSCHNQLTFPQQQPTTTLGRERRQSTVMLPHHVSDSGFTALSRLHLLCRCQSSLWIACLVHPSWGAQRL